MVAPAADVWGRISDELALGTGGAGGGSGTGLQAAPSLASVPDAGSENRTSEPSTPDAPATPSGTAPDGDLAAVVPLRRRRAAPWIAAAAAAGVVAGGAGGAWWAGQDTSPAPAVVAQASLDPLPGWQATGEAVVEESDDGTRTLVLDLDAPTGDDAFREVWLIDRDVTRLVSLGVLDGTEGRFTVPSGLDLSDFAVVDVSEEPYDGDPAHSGDSILRGLLDT
nr:anti-sigma factor [Cellulomonas sp. APG4]